MTPEEQWLQQKEKALAWMRLGFSVVAIVVIQLNPERSGPFRTLSILSTYSFCLYSSLVVYLTRRGTLDSRKIGLATTFLDFLGVSLMVYSTGGSRTPFFVYYLFPIITASSRYGTKGGLIAAFMGVMVYGLIRFFGHRPLGVDIFIIRSAYIVVLAYIFGFLSEFEKRQNEKLMALYKTAAEAATQEERRRISRELHDRLLQALASLSLRIETCRKHFMEDPNELRRELQLMEQAARTSVQEIRDFLSGRDAQILQPGTLLERLKEEMRFLRDGLGLRAILESEPEDLNLPGETEREIYCVLREGLMNVARHSQASRVEVLLELVDSQVRGSIQDDGTGFDPTKPTNADGLGLSSMEERIKKLGGKLSIESAPGKGTKVLFTAPLNRTSPEPHKAR